MEELSHFKNSKYDPGCALIPTLPKLPIQHQCCYLPLQSLHLASLTPPNPRALTSLKLHPVPFLKHNTATFFKRIFSLPLPPFVPLFSGSNLIIRELGKPHTGWSGLTQWDGACGKRCSREGWGSVCSPLGHRLQSHQDDYKRLHQRQTCMLLHKWDGCLWHFSFNWQWQLCQALQIMILFNICDKTNT